MSLFTKEVIDGFYKDLFSRYGRDKVVELFTNYPDEFKKLRIITKSDVDSNIELSKQFNQRKGSICDIDLEPYFRDTISSKDLTIDYAMIIEDTPRGRMYAILIAQKGECTGKPDIWNVRLVCNRSGERAVGFGGNASKLIGLFVYALNHGGHDYGMLEVAGGHFNIAAYCAYARYGFQETFMTECQEFTDGNLPMFIQMEFIGDDKDERTNKIIQAVMERTKNVKDGTGPVKYCKVLRGEAGLSLPPVKEEEQSCSIQ